MVRASSLAKREQVCVVAMVLVTFGCGRTPLGVGHDAGGSVPLAVGSGGMGSTGRGGSGGPSGSGGGSVGSGLRDSGSDTAEFNSHGDCVLADTVSDAAMATHSCKPIYDDELWCSPWVRTGPCGSYLVIELSGGESTNRCFYDASTRRLAAEHDCSDYNQYCDHRAFCTWQGQDVGSCYSYDRLPAQTCQDAASVVRDAQTLPADGDGTLSQIAGLDSAMDTGTEETETDACINAFPGEACVDGDVPCPAPLCDGCAFWDCSDGQWVLKHACLYICG